MPLESAHRDFGYLWDMRAYAQEAMGFVQGMTEVEYQHDVKTQRAAERSIEIVGEAASKVSPGLQQEHPEIAWREIRGLRTRLAHDYSGIKAEAIWDITQRDLRLLVIQLNRILGETPDYSP